MLHSDRLRPRSREWEGPIASRDGRDRPKAVVRVQQGTGQRQDYRLRKVVLLKFLTQT